jgi:GT2 family glycosyltransferase/glycosyltransferase involved in cell wall biosynthesis
LASIIIPVYNQIEFTLHCLKSIQENPSIASAEVIVLDDASQDETQEILPRVPGIRYFRNGSNLGFLRTCNRAASEARGEYLVFLNNDTEVQKDWLDKMLAVFERDEHAGIVGAKLIYPNGCLQEAGSLIWSDGSVRNFGRDDDPSKPEYNYLRETDYCSGACIAIKASLFRDVNGFDELYEPAYYEDVDLAFKVREKGYKVLYQPAASVTHFEGGTCGTDLNSGVKSYQAVNANKFLLKWSEVLKEHCAPEGRRDLTAARDRRVVGRCLFVDVWPTPDRDAGSIYTIYLIKLFQRFFYKVTFFPGNVKEHFGKYTEELQQMGVECLYEPFAKGLEEYLEGNGYYFDVVVLCRAGQAIPYFNIVRDHCPKAKIIFHTVDLHFLREERAAYVRGSLEALTRAQQLKKDELEVCAKADCTLVPSMAEASILTKEVLSAYVECIPFSANLPGRKKSFDDRQDIAFIAGYLHEPNVDAVTYFVTEIWPHIAERLPDVRFLMVGSNMPESVFSLANDRVKAVGYVEDLDQFLENCRLTVAPVRFGAGIKGKVITSLGLGVPVVASSVAVEGMGCEHGVQLLIADTVAEWTEYVARIYTNEDLWEYLSDNGLSLMRETYSIAAGVPRVRAMLHRIGCPLPSQIDGMAENRHSTDFTGSNGSSAILVGGSTDPSALLRTPAMVKDTAQVRTLAFYLPQYHPIPENDTWWGTGFTEWTSVTRAKPLFPGHYQPHLPSELGFYDLRMEEVRDAQAALAREYGIYGFCYHYYWFGGKRVLERPLDQMLASGKPDFPFCLCWANENWTRRWDGRDQEVLLKQDYAEGWERAFIRDLVPALKDRRYVRVSGKPLLLVYRTESLPDPNKAARIWREEAVRAGIGDLYLCRVESFAASNPDSIGFDAACQFPPLLISPVELDPASVLNGRDASTFKGKMFDYRELARAALTPERSYKLFFGVTPSWDNTPRRNTHAYMWSNDSSGAYENWLAQAVKNTVGYFPADERLIFVNAWNEWGEGCHLEPDRRHGRAFLEATRRALNVYTDGCVSVPG